MSLSCYLFNIEPLYFWSIVIICIIIISLCYNFYVRRTCGKFEDKNINLDGKTVLITGANGGLGKATAKYMAKRGARIIMACRNMKTAEEAKLEIIAESENRNVVLYPLDLSSFQSIRKFANTISQFEPRLDILIHNAAYSGVFYSRKSRDNIELTMAVNLYGPCLLTHSLLELMKKSSPSKIVMVSSKAHTLSYFNPTKAEHLNPLDYWLPITLYADSKFAGLLYMYELARRLKGTGVSANVVHPGTCDSPIWEKSPFPFSIAVNIARKLMKTTEQGIQTILYASLSKEVENATGIYYRDCKIGKSHKKTYDTKWQGIMWNEIMKIINLSKE